MSTPEKEIIEVLRDHGYRITEDVCDHVSDLIETLDDEAEDDSEED